MMSIGVKKVIENEVNFLDVEIASDWVLQEFNSLEPHISNLIQTSSRLIELKLR